MECDVAIVGAGAAGLAAAHAVQQAGRSAIVLEARDRIGGRVWSYAPAGAGPAAELGAEFIHGRPASTLALLRRAQMLDVGVCAARWELRDGRLVDMGEALSTGDLMEQVAALREDESVETFLQRFAGDPQRVRAAQTVRMLVEGFDAAEPARASIRAIAQEWAGDASLEAGESRPAGPYAAVLERLLCELDPARAQLLLQTSVSSLRWRREDVRITALRFGEPLEIRARAAIVTVSIGVLQQQPGAEGAIAFEPALPRRTLEAIGLIAMGPVVKVVLHFPTPFWESLDGGRYGEAGFFHVPGGTFPTVWTKAPTHQPVLTAWAGGPAARRLATLERDAILRRLFDQLGILFGETATRELPVAAYVHDWDRDPFARGAYSYLTVGADWARDVLKEPIEATLFIAGEALGGSSESGTVSGALDSGAEAGRMAAAKGRI